MSKKTIIALSSLLVLSSCNSTAASDSNSSSINEQVSSMDNSSTACESEVSNPTETTDSSSDNNSFSEEASISEDNVEYKASFIFEESSMNIKNPDQGFYHPIYVKCSNDGISYANYVINDNDNLYHLRIDISKFSKASNGVEDIELTSNVLEGLDELLSLLTAKEKSCIVRFAYDPGFNGSANMEPSLEMMQTHVQQIALIINKYKKCISAVEVGMFGPWGEMHTSSIAKYDNISLIIGKFLECIDELPILVRTPAMIYNYLGITINDIENYTIPEESIAYRLGMFNDGYLGSDSDLGTYSNREKEVNWISKQTSHLPYGGEVTIPSSTLHNIDNCLDEMFLINLSYLNYEWNNEVVSKWQNSYYNVLAGNDTLYYGKTAFEYISNHMGYRLVLKESNLIYNKETNNLNINVLIDNVGFGNVNREKEICLYLIDKNGDCIKYEMGNYQNEKELSFNIENVAPSSNYKVYLSLHNGFNELKSTYSIKFANDDIYNEDINANYIGEIKA